MRVWLGVVGVFSAMMWACSVASERSPETNASDSASASKINLTDTDARGTRFCSIREPGSCGPGQSRYACEVNDAGSHPIERALDGGVGILDDCSALLTDDDYAEYCCPSACIENDNHWRELHPAPYDADVFPSCVPEYPRMVLCPVGTSAPEGCQLLGAGSPYSALCCK